MSTPSDEKSNVHQQRVNNIGRDLVGYAAAAEEAGLKIVTRFSMDTVVSLRSVMTLRMWRLLKRVFSNETGWDVFGSVDNLQKETKKIELQYECGTVTASTGEIVHFVRVANVKEVVFQLVNELRKAQQLIYLDNLDTDALWLHIACDKGGKSTKLILQVINQKDRHSIDFAKLIGYFEGKDDRYNLEQIFGPIIKDLEDTCRNISELQLFRPPPLPPSQEITCCDHQACDGKSV